MILKTYLETRLLLIKTLGCNFVLSIIWEIDIKIYTYSGLLMPLITSLVKIITKKIANEMNNAL